MPSVSFASQLRDSGMHRIVDGQMQGDGGITADRVGELLRVIT